MQKDFTIEAEVRLFAHWRAPAKSPEEQVNREAVNEKLGVIACDLDEVVNKLIEI